MFLLSQIDATLRLAKELQQAKRDKEQAKSDSAYGEQIKFGPVIDSLELEIRKRPARDFHDDSSAPYSYQSKHDLDLQDQDFERRR